MRTIKRYLLKVLVAAVVGALVGVVIGGMYLGNRWDASAILGGGLAVALVIFYGLEKIGAGVPSG
jgi:hypothetical protein